MKQFVRTIRTKPLAVVASVLVVMAMVAVGFGMHQAGAQTVQDCTNNSIIKCGAASPADFIAKLRANNPADLQAIYSDFHLPAANYNDFAAKAKLGTAYKNGTIVVDGQTVATNTWSIGRQQLSYSSPDVISGHTYYKSYSKDVFRSDSIPVMTYFDANGNLLFAVLTACGNPMGGDVVRTTGTCDLLQKTAVANQANTYQFTSKATAANGSKISKVVYDFGDGSATVTATDPAAPQTHSFTQNSTVKVTAYITNVGGVDVPVTSTTCMTQITYQQPVTPTPTPAPTPTPTPTPAPQPVSMNGVCDSLTATAVDSTNPLNYTFVASTSMSNAQIKSVSFDYGDGMASPSVAPASSTATTVTIIHPYAKSPHDLPATATVSFVSNDAQHSQTKTSTCSTTVNAAATPAAVVTTASTTPQPVAATAVATTLPATGPTGVIAVFSAAVVSGVIGSRLYLRRRLKRVEHLVNNL